MSNYSFGTTPPQVFKCGIAMLQHECTGAISQKTNVKQRLRCLSEITGGPIIPFPIPKSSTTLKCLIPKRSAAIAYNPSACLPAYTLKNQD